MSKAKRIEITSTSSTLSQNSLIYLKTQFGRAKSTLLYYTQTQKAVNTLKPIYINVTASTVATLTT